VRLLVRGTYGESERGTTEKSLGRSHLTAVVFDFSRSQCANTQFSDRCSHQEFLGSQQSAIALASTTECKRFSGGRDTNCPDARLRSPSYFNVEQW
jgi:hypothetical protein